MTTIPVTPRAARRHAIAVPTMPPPTTRTLTRSTHPRVHRGAGTRTMGCDVPLRCIDRAPTGNYARRVQTRPPAGEAARMEQPRSDDVIHVPASVRFPVELVPPDGFDPARLETWPHVEGRLEWVGGRLLYMPPCGEMQQATVADVVGVLISWQRAHPEFSVGHQRSRHAPPRGQPGARPRRRSAAAA